MENPVNDPVGKGIALASLFFIVTPLVIGISLFSLLTLNENSPAVSSVSDLNLLAMPKSGVKAYASLPINFSSIGSEVGISDARAEIIRQYLAFYNSPLVSFADQLVSAADRYNLDFRLLTAIAQQESNLCKIIPPGTFNCWGWGIHSKGTLGFSSFEEGIDIVSRGIKTEYIDKGLVTPEEIMTKYTPLSNGSWAIGVTKFLSEME